ncbi:MAG TPA: PadR family transcriptional regulator [Bryobacteraceae bacterium]|nr:PadR family transcriptional regulator [Bryobacteraceae bacterium]
MTSALEPPLTPAVFFTLFALAGGKKHGYAIMQETRTLSDGSFRMGPATLYTTLQRLLELDLVEEAEDARDADSRRRTYQLTAAGRALLGAELERVESLLRKARAMHWKPARAKP